MSVPWGEKQEKGWWREAGLDEVVLWKWLLRSRMNVAYLLLVS